MTNLLNINSANGQNLDTARSSEAVQTLRGAKAAGNDPRKIDKAAKNFESLLIGHWLEQAEKSFASVPGTDPDQKDDSSRDQFMSIACESLAKGLCRTGGFGIAAMISKRLEAVTIADKRDLPPSPQSGEKEGSHNSIRIK